MMATKTTHKKKLTPAVRENGSTQDYPALLAEVKAEFVGKVQFYLAALDAQVRQEDENPSICVFQCSRSLSPTPRSLILTTRSLVTTPKSPETSVWCSRLPVEIGHFSTRCSFVHSSLPVGNWPA
jgi:hypothetical protein